MRNWGMEERNHWPKATLFTSGRNCPDPSLSPHYTVCCFEDVLKELEHQKPLIYSSRNVQSRTLGQGITQYTMKLKRQEKKINILSWGIQDPRWRCQQVITQMHAWELLQGPRCSSGFHLCSHEHLIHVVLGNIRINPVSQWSSTQSKGSCLVCACGRGLWIGPWFVHVGMGSCVSLAEKGEALELMP